MNARCKTCVRIGIDVPQAKNYLQKRARLLAHYDTTKNRNYLKHAQENLTKVLVSAAEHEAVCEVTS